LEEQTLASRQAIEGQLGYIKRLVEYNEPEEKVKHLIQSAQLLKAESDTIIRQMEALQKQLIQQSGGLTREGLYQNPNEKANIHSILFEEKGVENLTKRVEKFLRQIQDVGIREVDPAVTEKALTIPPNLYESYLKEANLATALSMLSAFQVDRLRYFESILSTYEQAIKRQLKLKRQKDVLVSYVLIMVERDKLKQGDLYEAEVALGKKIIDPARLKAANLNGKKIPLVNGTAQVKFKALGVGKKTFKAGITLQKHGGGDTTLTVEQEYTVIPRRSFKEVN
jgi:hypothetical protein